MVRIKICGMRDPLNVETIVELKPDYLGFIFYPESPRYVGNEPDSSIFDNIPSGIERTGVFVDEDHDKILDLASVFGLETVQLHGNETPEYCIHIRSSGLTVIKSFNIDEDFDFSNIISYIKGCDYFLFDAKSEKIGGSGKKFQWEKLEEYSLDKSFFLSGGIGPEDVVLLNGIKNRGLFAIDINSRFEIAPGLKDCNLIKNFMEEFKNSRK